jgi:hypothetical protein
MASAQHGLLEPDGAFITTPMPHPTMGNTGQKNPCEVIAQITTRNALTST